MAASENAEHTRQLEPGSGLSKDGPTRIYVDVVGDLFHAGHINLFKAATRLVTDLGREAQLVIGVHSDETVASYKRKPIINMEGRMAVVRELRCVSEVIPDAPLRITHEYMDKHKIDLVVHGDDITEENAQMMYTVPIERGAFRLCKYTSGISTTDIINSISRRFSGAQAVSNAAAGKVKSSEDGNLGPSSAN